MLAVLIIVLLMIVSSLTVEFSLIVSSESDDQAIGDEQYVHTEDTERKNMR